MKNLLLLLLIILIGQELKACDQCNAVVGSGAISEGHYIGYRLRYRRHFLEVDMKKSLGNSKHLDHYNAEGELKELYTAHELFGSYHIHGDWHITASIPVVNNYRSSNGVTVNDIYGVGDPWVMGRYQHVRKGDKSRFVFGAGLGIKLPLGSTSTEENDTKVDLDMQPGNGSMDYLSNLVLLYEYQGWLVMSQNTFKWNGLSPGEYRYGNALASGLDFGKTILDKGEDSWRVNVMVGPYTEWTGRDEQDGVIQGDISRMLFVNAGLIVRNNRAVLSINGQRGVKEDMDSRQLPTTHRFLMSLKYDF